MKGFSEFKGYLTQTIYDAAAGQFAHKRIDYPGFEVKAETAKPAKPAKPKPAPRKTRIKAQAAERLTALRQRIEAGRVAARNGGSAHPMPRFGALPK
jgi:hypothetical protein